MKRVYNNYGETVIVNGDCLINKFGNKRKVIGANYTHGVMHGGYLSSFDESFGDELIGIESGLEDIINAKMGDVSETYRELQRLIEERKPSDIYELTSIVYDVVDTYFGGIANISLRMSYYSEDKENYVSDLKGKGSAMCAERAALTQNLLKFLGINSLYKCSGISKNGIAQIHAYNLINIEDKYFVLDTSIPTLKGGVICPIVGEIPKDVFDLIACPLSSFGISVSVSHYNPVRNEDVEIVYDDGRIDNYVIDSGSVKS